jgi:hypothetical protein
VNIIIIKEHRDFGFSNFATCHFCQNSKVQQLTFSSQAYAVSFTRTMIAIQYNATCIITLLPALQWGGRADTIYSLSHVCRHNYSKECLRMVCAYLGQFQGPENRIQVSMRLIGLFSYEDCPFCG